MRADTVAGCIYYVYDSQMVREFEGLAVKGYKEKVRLVGGMERMYWFGERKGAGMVASRVGGGVGLSEGMGLGVIILDI